MSKIIYATFLLLGVFFNLLAQAAIFNYEPLSQDWKEKLAKAKYWQPGCPVALERLNLLTFSYYDFKGNEQLGQLVVMDAAAPELTAAFKELYQQRFPLEKPVAVVDKDHDKEGLTIAFTCRPITGGGNASLHSYGLAIDINVERNPYAGEYQVTSNGQVYGRLIPNGSLGYLNRSVNRPGMNEAIVDIMQKHGFNGWGGDWRDRIDYMHFQVARPIAQQLAYLDPQSAATLYQLTIKYPQSAANLTADTRWFYLYKLYPQQYIKVLQDYFPKLATEKESQVFDKVYQALANSAN